LETTFSLSKSYTWTEQWQISTYRRQCYIFKFCYFGDVGKNSAVGAGSVVFQSCHPNSVLAGKPVKIVGQRKNKQYI